MVNSGIQRFDHALRLALETEQARVPATGTEGSNPSPSAMESANCRRSPGPVRLFELRVCTPTGVGATLNQN